MPQYIDKDCDCLLENLINGLDLVLSVSYSVSRGCRLVRSVNEILRHGLKDDKIGYWHIIREITHPETRKSLARSLKHVSDPYDRGSLWIYYTLVEGSLDCYLHCLTSDGKSLIKYYQEFAFLRSGFHVDRLILQLSLLSEISLIPQDSLVATSDLDDINKFEMENVISNSAYLELETPNNNNYNKNELYSPADSCVTISDSLDSQNQNFISPEVEKSNWEETVNESTEEDLELKKEHFEDVPLSEVHDSVVVLRKNQSSDNRKRVSFHQDILDEETRVKPVLERHSLNEEKLSFFSQLFPGLSKDVEKGAEAAIWPEERGAPEGQEDPQEKIERSPSPLPLPPPPRVDSIPREKDNNNLANFPPALGRSEKFLSQLRGSTSSLARRSRQSKDLTDKLAQYRKIHKKVANQRWVKRHWLKLYPGPHEVNQELCAEVDNLIENELFEIPSPVEESHLYKRLRLHLMSNTVVKIFEWTTLTGTCVLVALTEDRLCLFKSISTSEYFTIETYCYSDMDTIVCCSDAITIILNDKRLVTLVSKGDSGEMCSKLSLMVPNLNFRRLLLDEFAHLNGSDSTPLAQECKFYSWVHIGSHLDIVPNVERSSHLMYQFGSKWLLAEVSIGDKSFELKSEVEEVKFRLIDIIRCDRVATCRPHTFKISFSNKRCFTLAAADDYEMSDWMQAVLLSSSEIPNSVLEKDNRTDVTYCCLLATSQFLYTAAFPDHITNTLSIADISTLHTSQTYCIIEVECLEANASSIFDWTLFFSSDSIMTDFISYVTSVRPSIKQVNVRSSHPLKDKCESSVKQIVLQFQNLMLAL